MFKVSIQQNEKDNEIVIAPVGELDNIATTEMGDALNRVTDLASHTIVMDCRDLEYISSSGLRFFMQLKKSSEQKGGSVVVKNLNEDVAEIFHLSGFHHIFDLE